MELPMTAWQRKALDTLACEAATRDKQANTGYMQALSCDQAKVESLLGVILGTPVQTKEVNGTFVHDDVPFLIPPESYAVLRILLGCPYHRVRYLISSHSWVAAPQESYYDFLVDGTPAAWLYLGRGIDAYLCARCPQCASGRSTE